MFISNQEKFAYIKFAMDELDSKLQALQSQDASTGTGLLAGDKLGHFQAQYYFGLSGKLFDDLAGFSTYLKDFIRNTIPQGTIPTGWENHVQDFLDGFRQQAMISAAANVDYQVPSRAKLKLDLSELSVAFKDELDVDQILKTLEDNGAILTEMDEYSYPGPIDDFVSARYEAFVDELFSFIEGQGAEETRDHVEEQYTYWENRLFKLDDPDGNHIGYVFHQNMYDVNNNENGHFAAIIFDTTGQIVSETFETTIDY